jgi:hypothetical protein
MARSAAKYSSAATTHPSVNRSTVDAQSLKTGIDRFPGAIESAAPNTFMVCSIRRLLPAGSEKAAGRDGIQ